MHACVSVNVLVEKCLCGPLMCILYVPTHLCLTREQLFVFRQWGQANEISVAEEMTFPGKSLWRKTGS